MAESDYPSGFDVNTQQSSMSPEMEAKYLWLMDQAVKFGQQQYGGQGPITPQSIAGFNPEQIKALQMAQSGIGAYQPMMDKAEAATDSMVNAQFDPSSYKDYLNPYQDYVTQGIEDQFDQARNQAAAQAVQTGAFGTEREGIQRAELDATQAETVGQSLAQAYGQAQGMAQQAYGTGAQQQMAMGQGAQQMAMGDISNLMQSGAQQQQLLQTAYDADYRQKLQQMYEPYQRLGFVSDIFQGAPTSASSLAMATTPQANPLAQAVGAGISGLAAYQGYKQLTNQG